MEARYLNAYLKFIDKASVFESLASEISAKYPELGTLPDHPDYLDADVPTVITAKYLNTVFNYYYGVLVYLYKVSSEVESLLTKEQDLIKSNTDSLSSTISELYELITRIQGNNLEDDYVTLLSDSELTLPISDTTSLHSTYLDADHVSTSTVAGMVKYTHGSPSLAIDGDPTTLWCDRLCTTGRVTTNIDGQYIDGAGIVFTAEFDHAVPINHIVIDPMGGYPMSLMGVKFYYGDMEVYTSGISGANSFTIDYLPDDKVQFRFSVIQADKIELIFIQSHYVVVDTPEVVREVFTTKKNYLASVGTKEASIIYNLIASELSTVSTIDSTYINKILDELGSEFKMKDRVIDTTKSFEYVFGARGIEFYYTTYKPTGSSSTSKYDIDTNIYSISLTTEDTHSDGSLINYVVKLGDSFAFPILPTNYSIVRDRLYFVNNSATTTFPVTGDVTMYVNDELSDYFTSEVITGNYIKVSLRGGSIIPDNNICYAEYTPAITTELILTDYVTDPVYVEESLVFDSNGKTVLSAVPYVNMDIINDPLFTRQDTYSASYYYTGSDFYTIGGNTYGKYDTGYVYYSSDPDRFYASSTIPTGEFPDTVYITVGDYTWLVTDIQPGYFEVSGNISSYYTELDSNTYTIGASSTGPVLSYSPLVLEINDTTAYNITSYEEHEVPLFSDDVTLQYYNDGKTVYTNKTTDSTVVAKYCKIVDYIQIFAQMSQRSIHDQSETPVISNITMAVKPRI